VQGIVNDAKRAGEIVSRIRLLLRKGAPQRESVDLNEIIREMIVLLRSELMRRSISVRAELAPDLPYVMGDRVQLQQVMMNLMTNSIDAMKDVNGPRELAIKSQRAEHEQVMVSVSDTGVGLPPRQTDQIFHAFFTTKWACPSAAPSLNRIAADCGLPTTLRAAQVFTSHYRPAVEAHDRQIWRGRWKIGRTQNN
jgi:C4-dicarboxylate-specific signal transduction histidine kinase